MPFGVWIFFPQTCEKTIGASRTLTCELISKVLVGPISGRLAMSQTWQWKITDENHSILESRMLSSITLPQFIKIQKMKGYFNIKSSNIINFIQDFMDISYINSYSTNISTSISRSMIFSLRISQIFQDQKLGKSAPWIGLWPWRKIQIVVVFSVWEMPRAFQGTIEWIDV